MARVAEVYPAMLENKGSSVRTMLYTRDEVISKNPKLDKKIKEAIEVLDCFYKTEWQGPILSQRDVCGADVSEAPCVKWLVSRCNFDKVFKAREHMCKNSNSHYGWDVAGKFIEHAVPLYRVIYYCRSFVYPVLQDACYDERTIFIRDVKENRKVHQALFLLSIKRPAWWFDPMALGMETEDGL